MNKEVTNEELISELKKGTEIFQKLIKMIDEDKDAARRIFNALQKMLLP